MAKPTKPPALQSISLDALSTVNGGRTSAAAPSASASKSTTSSGDPNSQLMTLLTEIVSSLQDMNKQRNQDPFMRAVMLMQAMRGTNNGGGGPFGGGSPF